MLPICKNILLHPHQTDQKPYLFQTPLIIYILLSTLETIYNILSPLSFPHIIHVPVLLPMYTLIHIWWYYLNIKLEHLFFFPIYLSMPQPTNKTLYQSPLLGSHQGREKPPSNMSSFLFCLSFCSFLGASLLSWTCSFHVWICKLIFLEFLSVLLLLIMVAQIIYI